MNYTTKEQIISSPREAVFNKLSDFKNLEPLTKNLTDSPVTIEVIDSNKCDIAIPMGGNLTVYFKEKVPHEKLVLSKAISALPISFDITITLKDIEPQKTAITLNLDADLPGFAKALVGNKLNDGMEKIAEMLTRIPY